MSQNFESEHKIIEMSKQCWQLSKCSCPCWKKKFVCKHVIGVGYNMGLLSFPTLDLRIEKNVSKGRRKKALPALERNSMGPINQELFSMPTSSNQTDIPITTETQTIQSESNNLFVLQAVNFNSTQLVQKRGRGRPRKDKTNKQI